MMGDAPPRSKAHLSGWSQRLQEDDSINYKMKGIGEHALASSNAR